MKVPRQIATAAYNQCGRIPEVEHAPDHPFVVGHVNDPATKATFIYPLHHKTIIKCLVADECDATGWYPVIVTHEVGWAIVMYIDERNRLIPHLWYAGEYLRVPPFHAPHLVLRGDLDALMQATKLAEPTAYAALCNVGPNFAPRSLHLLKWLAERSEAKSWAQFRCEILELWHFCQFCPSKLRARLVDNPVVPEDSPDLRVIMYGVKCAVLA